MTYLDFFPLPMSDAAVVVACLAAGLVAFGLGIAYFATEPHSPATRAFALSVAAAGITMAFTGPLMFAYESGAALSWFLRFPVFELMIYLGQAAWLLEVARAAQLAPRMVVWIKACVWTSWAMALAYFSFAVLFPVERIAELVCVIRGNDCVTSGIWPFALPIGAAVVAYNLGLLSLLTQHIDRVERIRVNFVLLAVLFGYGPYYLPAGYGAISQIIAQLIMATGFIRYYGLQGQRGVFMSRFLSPEVSKLVREKGLEYTMQSQSMEITAVCCDLRGFTKLSQLLASDQVIRLLNEYYDVVGKVVAEFHGTIKDYAGDGVLILIGAPLPVAEHAKQGLAMAQRLQQAAANLIAHWAGPEMKLGFGVGVASGRVTVGAVGSASRMEYSAVGPAVNLAARLCAQAADGEILVDARTAELAGDASLQSRAALTLKGMGEVPHFTCSSA